MTLGRLGWICLILLTRMWLVPSAVPSPEKGSVNIVEGVNEELSWSDLIPPRGCCDSVPNVLDLQPRMNNPRIRRFPLLCLQPPFLFAFPLPSFSPAFCLQALTIYQA